MIGPSVALERALEERGPFRLLAAEETPWASVMFSGARHRLRMEMAGDVAERFLDGIENAEFDLGEHLLADIAAEQAEAADGLVTVEIEALTIEDGDFVILEMVKSPPHRTVKAQRMQWEEAA